MIDLSTHEMVTIVFWGLIGVCVGPFIGWCMVQCLVVLGWLLSSEGSRR
jgi:hypothetical protein